MTIDISRYLHFSFDLWLTLIRSNPLFKQKRNQLLIDFFELNTKLERVNEVVRYYDVLCNQMNEITGSNIETEEMYILMLSALNVDLEKVNTDHLDEFYKATEQLFLEYKPELIVPNIYQLLDQIIQQEKTISILSNTAMIKGTTLRMILQHYEINHYCAFQIYSDEVGISKPNVEIYKLLIQNAQKYNNNIKEIQAIVHIGDNPIADFKGAQKAGIQSILIKNKYSEIQF